MVKEENGWLCERCRHGHDPAADTHLVYLPGLHRTCQRDGRESEADCRRIHGVGKEMDRG